MKNIDFEKFNPVYGRYIDLPKNTILYNLHNIADDKPIFLKSHKCKDDNDASYITQKELKLLDIRYMNILLKDILKYRFDIIKDISLDVIENISFSLGLIGYKLQLEFLERYININNDKSIIDGYNNMKIYYDNYINTSLDMRNNIVDLFELDGIRISIIEYDKQLKIILKKIFSEYCDGYISPCLFSPFHKNYHVEEILLFDITNNIKKEQIDNIPLSISLDNMLLFNNLDQIIWRHPPPAYIW